MYYTYVIFSKSYNKIYTGFTSDLDGRLIAHNHPRNKGWTRKFAPWVLVYSERFDLKKDAMAREKELKSGRGRTYVWEKVEEYLKQDTCSS